MTLADDIADAHEVIPLETLTYTDADGATTPDAKAYSTDPSSRELSTGGVAGIKIDDNVWMLAAPTVPNIPEINDTLTDSAGDVWTILTFTIIKNIAVHVYYRCICRKQV